MRMYCAGVAVVGLLSFVATADADSSRMPREVRSENGEWLLKIEAGRPGRNKARPCVATLIATSGAPYTNAAHADTAALADGAGAAESDSGESDRRGESRRGGGRVQWERPLVNDVAPAAVLVRDDGRFVVTLGEYRKGGARHALVIYGERGQLLRHFILTDLLGADDWQHVRKTRDNVEWLKDADLAFVETDRFVIDLEWGKKLTVDLKSLRLLNEDEPENPADEVPPEFRELLSHSGDDEGAAAAADALAMLAEKMDTTPETLQQLLDRGLVDVDKLLAELALTDPAAAEAMAAALAAREADAPVEPTPDSSAAAVADAAGEDPADAPASTEAMVAETPDELVADELSAAADGPGIMVPAPDPSNPVDYVSWLNAMTQTPGENAGPILMAAQESLVPWTGSDDLYNAAVDGSAEALNSPEIQAWLDANAPALDQMRQATEMEFQGWQVQSDDGSLVGVLLPALSPTRQLAKTAVLDSLRLMQRGDFDSASARVLDTLALGSQAGAGPTLIENLVGVAVQSLGADTLLDLVERAPADFDFANLAEQTAQKYRPTRPMEESIQFERAFFLDSMQRMFKPDPATGALRLDPRQASVYLSMTSQAESTVDKLKTIAELAAVDFDQTLAQANQYYDALSAAVKLPYPEARAAMKQLESQIEHGNAVMRMLTPALSRAAFLKKRAETQRRAALLVTRVMAHKQRHGRLPESLEELGDPDLVLDPLSGQHFAYRRDGDQFSLYSLGQDGVDNGGVHDRKAEVNDLVYWPRPPKNQ